ncbi:MAG TPA: S41 family peptidase [Prolixibacteraceae bacterium]|jgi:hypothetical protein
MRTRLFTILILTITFSCRNQQASEDKSTEYELIRQANKFGQLFIDKNYEGMVDKLYQPWVEKIGKDKLMKQFIDNNLEFKLKGIILDSIIFRNPSKIIVNGSQLQTTITQLEYGKNLNDAYKSKYAIALSNDRGKKWFFIPSVNNFQDLKEKFPDLDSSLAFHNDTLGFENTPLNNFKILWCDFKINYPLFELNHIDWDSVYRVNCSKITSQTTNQELYAILSSSILTLKDQHTDLKTQFNAGFAYQHSICHNRPANFISLKIIDNYIWDKLQKVNDHISFGTIKKGNIGYIYIGSFECNEKDYYFIDDFLKMHPDLKGMIIDIRQNGGGNEGLGLIVASRFTNRPVTYRYARKRNGPDYSDLGDCMPMVLNPGGTVKFLKPVILLTNRKTFSAAEDFTLMLKCLPNVIQMGDTTTGGVGTNPRYKPLPNGWEYRIAYDMSCDWNKKPIKNGIAPQVPIWINKKDQFNGNDRILEAAIKQLNMHQ